MMGLLRSRFARHVPSLTFLFQHIFLFFTFCNGRASSLQQRFPNETWFESNKMHTRLGGGDDRLILLYPCVMAASCFFFVILYTLGLDDRVRNADLQ